MLQRKCWAGVALASIGLPALCMAITLNVPGDFATIQACIDAAVSGVDECVAAPGTYHETINFLGKAITLRSSGGADVTTIDATGLGGSVVTCASGEGLDTVLDGFTITGGKGTTYDGHPFGGGMFNYNSSPTVTNCAFRGNVATVGGGMANYFGHSEVTHSTFDQNSALFGGGMSNHYSNTTVTQCSFHGNAADGGPGGGMYNEHSDPTVAKCSFTGNTGPSGAGMFNYRRSPTLINCTFAGNKATSGGGIHNAGSGTPMISNCVFWGDSPNEIVNTPSAPSVRFSDVQGGLPVGAVDDGSNINLDPMFVRPPDPGPDDTWDGVDDDYGDLRLRPGSPCINAGDPGFVAQPEETDLEGHARVLCGRVDMGAYEFAIGDYNCDQRVDLTDFAHWSACMTGPSTADTAVPHAPGCEAFDFDGDGDVDMLDFSAFQGAFRGSSP